MWCKIQMFRIFPLHHISSIAGGPPCSHYYICIIRISCSCVNKYKAIEVREGCKNLFTDFRMPGLGGGGVVVNLI